MSQGHTTLIDKIWNDHLIAELGDQMCLVRIDRILLHERGGGIALARLSKAGRSVRCPEAVFGTFDHVVDTYPGRIGSTMVPGGASFIAQLREQAARHAIRLFEVTDKEQGIVHVISREQGIALPGCTLVCNDSHTCTVGGVGALGWGAGSSETELALATQSLVLARPRSMRVRLDGTLSAWVAAKDVILSLIGRVGADGGAGRMIEFTGSTIRAMSIDGRLTVCNMAVELGARSGIVAPDDVTFESLWGTSFAPTGELWEQAVAYWRTLKSDPEAAFDKEVAINCNALAPQVTWGISPAQVAPVDGHIPKPEDLNGQSAVALEHSLAYMGLRPGMALEGTPIDAAFIGSCTNGRITDLREAARVLRGRTVAPGIRALCVPGSSQTKRQAEQEGLDRIFIEAGFEWRESGCSLCFHAGGESFEGKRAITTTNRNFEHRQGRHARSHLASPSTVAASAVAGKIADVRKLGSQT